MSGRLFAVVTLLLAAIIPLGGNATATGSVDKPEVVDPAPFSYIAPKVRSLMDAQTELKELARPIMDIVRGSKKDLGFTGVALQGDHVQLWWHGEIPANIDAVIDKSVNKFRVTPAPRSLVELKAEAAPLRAAMRDTSSGIHTVAYRIDGTGLIVRRSPDDAAKSAAAVSRLSLDVAVAYEDAPRPEFTGRMNDSPSYYAGARIDNKTFHCTAGWPVHSNWILTAAHCGYPNQWWYNGSQTLTMGYVAREETPHDLMLVHADVTGGAQGRMWDGGVSTPGGQNTSSEYTKQILGSDHVYPGEWLCTSGSTSGALCGYQVTNNFPTDYCAYDHWGTYECYVDLFEAEQHTGYEAARGGDSGGPVFGLNGDMSKVIAKGVISGRRSNVFGQPRWLLFQDFITAVYDFNVTVVTP